MSHTVVCMHCTRVTEVSAAVDGTLRQVDRMEAILAALPPVVRAVAEAKATVTLPEGWTWGADPFKLTFVAKGRGQRSDCRPVIPAEGGWRVASGRNTYSDPQLAVDEEIARRGVLTPG